MRSGEDALGVLGRDARAVVGDADDHPVPVAEGLGADDGPRTPAGRVEGVEQQVHEDLPHTRVRPATRREVGVEFDLDRGDVRLGVAGKIRTPEDAERALAAGADWVMLGRAAILHHDFPNRYEADPRFVPVENPVTRESLADEGLSEAFITYTAGWKGFVSDEG